MAIGTTVIFRSRHIGTYVPGLNIARKSRTQCTVTIIQYVLMKATTFFTSVKGKEIPPLVIILSTIFKAIEKGGA